MSTGRLVPSDVPLEQPQVECAVVFVGSALVMVRNPSHGSFTLPIADTNLRAGDRVWVGEFDHMLGKRPMAVAFDRDGHRMVFRHEGPTPTQSFFAAQDREQELARRLAALGVDCSESMIHGSQLGRLLVERFGPVLADDSVRRLSCEAFAAAMVRWVPDFSLAENPDALVMRVGDESVVEHAWGTDESATLRAAMRSADALLDSRGVAARWLTLDHRTFLLAPPELDELARRFEFKPTLLEECRGDAARRADADAHGKSCYVLEWYQPPPADTSARWVDGNLAHLRDKLHRLLRSDVVGDDLWLWTIARGNLVSGLDLRHFVSVHFPNRAGILLDDRETWWPAMEEWRTSTAEKSPLHLEVAWETLVAEVPPLPEPLLRRGGSTRVYVAPGSPYRRKLYFDEERLRFGHQSRQP